MCKIMVIPGIKPELSQKAWEFSKAARPFLTKENNHAFGYAALGPQGLFGQRWLDVEQAFKSTAETKTSGANRLREIFGNLIKIGGVGNTGADYSEFGERSETIHSIILHARFATSGGGIENAHPFVVDNTALIHNGHINNADALQNKVSTCDSETILNEYIDSQTAEDPQRIQEVADKLMGWYAFATLAPSTEHGYIVDIAKDESTHLYAGYVVELDTVVFCTTQEVIRRAARMCKMNVGPIIDVPYDTLTRFNAYTGKSLGVTHFESGWLEELSYYSTGSKMPESTRDAIEAVNSKLMPIQPDVAVTDDGVSEASLDEDDATRELAVDDYMERTSGSTYSEAVKRASRRGNVRVKGKVIKWDRS